MSINAEKAFLDCNKIAILCTNKDRTLLFHFFTGIAGKSNNKKQT
jgi:hypothetical protein